MAQERGQPQLNLLLKLIEDLECKIKLTHACCGPAYRRPGFRCLPRHGATPRYRTRLGQNSIVGAGAGLLVVEAGCTGRLLPTRLGPSHYQTGSTHSPAGGREFATVPVAPVHERQLMIAESTLTASPLTRPVDRFGGERPLRRRWPARELAPGPAGRPVCCRIAVAPGPDAARITAVHCPRVRRLWPAGAAGPPQPGR